MAKNNRIIGDKSQMKTGNQTILISKVLPNKPFVKLVFSSFGQDDEEESCENQSKTQVFRVHSSPKESRVEMNILEAATQLIQVDDLDDDGGGRLEVIHNEESEGQGSTPSLETIVLKGDVMENEAEDVSEEEQVIKIVEENSAARGSYIVFANGSQYIVTDQTDTEEQNAANDSHEELTVNASMESLEEEESFSTVAKSQSKLENLITFNCEICKSNIAGQMEFFRHLKGHYETPRKGTKRNRVKTETKERFPDSSTVKSEPVIKTKSGRVSKPRYNPDMVSTKVLKPNIDSESGEESEVEIGVDGKKIMTKEKKTKKKIIAKKIETEDGKIKFECETCNKLFANTTSLSIHMLIHKGEKPLKCIECGRHFRQYSDLMYHRKSIHSDHKPYKCEYCDKEFARKYSLSIHRKVHTGIRDYKCDVCEKGFRAAIYLQEHKRIHTGERPFSCEICGHGFRLRHVLRRHVHFVHNVKNNSLKSESVRDDQYELDVKEEATEILAEVDDEDGTTQYVTVVAECEDDVEIEDDGSETRLVLISDDHVITGLNYANFQKIIAK